MDPEQSFNSSHYCPQKNILLLGCNKGQILLISSINLRKICEHRLADLSGDDVYVSSLNAVNDILVAGLSNSEVRVVGLIPE